MGAALHQRLDALAEGFHTGEEIIEGQQNALCAGYGGDFVEHSGNAGIGSNQRAHIDIDGGGGVSHLADVGVRAGAGILLALLGQPAQGFLVGAVLVSFPFGARGVVGFVGNHHKQYVGAHVAPGFVGSLFHARRGGGESGRGVNAFPAAEVKVGVFGGEFHPRVALPGADHLHRHRRLRADAAVVHGEEVTFEIAFAGAPEIAQDLHVFGQVVVATREVIVTRPEPHLLVLRLLPAGHQVHAKASSGDRVDGGGHARDDRRGQGERSGGSVDLNPRGDRGQSCHQGEGLQVVVPEFGLTAETAQLDHRERKVEVVMLRFLHDGFIQLKGRHVLRGSGRDKPAVVADRYKYANFHHEPLFTTLQVLAFLQRECQF